MAQMKTRTSNYCWHLTKRN